MAIQKPCQANSWLAGGTQPSKKPHLDVELSFSSKLLIRLKCPPSMLSVLNRLMKVGRSANVTGMGKAEEIHRQPFGSLARGAQACSQNSREGCSAPPAADICTALGPSLTPSLPHSSSLQFSSALGLH